jgi:hypothetical protein
MNSDLACIYLQRILGSSDNVGTVIRSCKDETFLQTGLLHQRISRICREKVKKTLLTLGGKIMCSSSMISPCFGAGFAAVSGAVFLFVFRALCGGKNNQSTTGIFSIFKSY